MQYTPQFTEEQNYVQFTKNTFLKLFVNSTFGKFSLVDLLNGHQTSVEQNEIRLLTESGALVISITKANVNSLIILINCGVDIVRVCVGHLVVWDPEVDDVCVCVCFSSSEAECASVCTALGAEKQTKTCDHSLLEKSATPAHTRAHTEDVTSLCILSCIRHCVCVVHLPVQCVV